MKSRLCIKEILKKYYSIEIEPLLVHVLKKPKEFLYMNGERKLSRIQEDELSRMVRRRQKGEPIAYILGYKDFYELRFMVNCDVLIPRPETEWFVDRITKYELRIRNEKQIRILDVGTGSGCIAISLSKNLKVKGKKIEITASDISEKALRVAKENAKFHEVKIKFIQSDLFQNIKGKFDIMVANLPYVPRKIYDLRFKDLKFEPKTSLVDVKKDSDIYHRFLKQIAALPSLPKAVFLEIDPSQKMFLSQIVKKYLPKADIKFSKDFNNFWRYLEIKI